MHSLKSKHVVVFLGVIFYCYVFVFQILPGTIASYLINKFKFNAVHLGYLSSAFYLSYAPLQLLFGFLLDKYKVEYLLIIMWFSAALGMLWFSLSGSLWSFVLSRFLLGAAASGAFITALYLGANYLESKYFAFYTGFVELLGALSGIFGSYSLLCLVRYYSWSEILLGLSIIGFLGGFLTLLGYRKGEDIKYKSSLTIKNQLVVLKNCRLWGVGLYSFFVWGPFLVLAGLWGGSFLQIKFRFTDSEAAELLNWLWWGLALGSLFLGYLVKKIKIKIVNLMVVVGIIGLLSILSLLGKCSSCDLIKLVLCGVGIGASGQTLAFIWLAKKIPQFVRGMANGLNNMLVVMGGIVLPVLFSYSLDFFWSGNLKDGIRVYQSSDFVYSLSWLVLCYLGAIFISCLLAYDEYELKKEDLL